MKTPVAAAIAISGVLVAGSAAALVNSQVFDSTPNESGASAAVLPPPSSVEVSIPDPTLPPPSTVPTTTLAPSTVPVTTEAAATGMLTAFEVGDAGVVTVDVIEGRLVFVSAEASAGWRIVERSDDDEEDSAESADEVEVVFESATVRVEFEVKLVGGEIVPHVESMALAGSAAPAPQSSTPSNTSNTSNTSNAPVVSGDDHDDRYEDDDDDDDRYEDDDDDRYEDEDEDRDDD